MTPGAYVEFYEDAAGEHRWRVLSANGNIVASSGEGFDGEGKAIRAFNTAAKTVETAHFHFAHPEIEG